MTTVTLIVTRPMLHAGNAYQAGERLDVDAATAAQILDAGRARLHRPEDLPLVRKAIVDATAAALRIARTPQAPVERITPPWASTF